MLCRNVGILVSICCICCHSIKGDMGVASVVNVIEAAVIFCLFGAALAILDENDIYVQKKTAIAFILLPLLYGLLYVVYLVIRLILK